MMSLILLLSRYKKKVTPIVTPQTSFLAIFSGRSCQNESKTDRTDVRVHVKVTEVKVSTCSTGRVCQLW